MSILIVEDNKTSAQILEFSLKKYNYEILAVGNGREALDTLKKEPGIRVVISDIMMPDMDGIELLTKMRETPDLKAIPVIMCTTMADSETVQKVIGLGCTDFVVKPIDPKIVARKIAKLTDDKTAVLEDKKSIMNQFGLDDETYRSSISNFRTFLDDLLPRMEKQLAAGSSPLQNNEAHVLFEQASNLGAKRVLNIFTKYGLLDENEPGGHNRENPGHGRLIRELQLLQRTLTDVNPSKAGSAESKTADGGVSSGIKKNGPGEISPKPDGKPPSDANEKNPEKKSEAAPATTSASG